MSGYLNNLLGWLGSYLPQDEQGWIEDMRIEAQHVPNGLARVGFLWGGVQAVFGEIIRRHIGPRRLGQGLLSLALLLLCTGGVLFATGMEDPRVRMTFYSLLTLYAIAGGLCWWALDVMKRFVLFCAVALIGIWVFLGLGGAASLVLPLGFLRAFSIEQAAMMVCLYIIASYLTWVEGAARA
ncbi:hypothetical protein [Litorimonas sp. WD9-15]|uniref:hypothetical protein n=1 Tax=Litorimonas sp. WD9-15 TaxID=3418716 RepID=UPI003D056C6B